MTRRAADMDEVAVSTSVGDGGSVEVAYTPRAEHALKGRTAVIRLREVCKTPFNRVTETREMRTPRGARKLPYPADAL